MEWIPLASLIFSIAAFGLGVLIYRRKGLWRISDEFKKIETTVKERFDVYQEQANASYAALERSIGETGRALREHMHIKELEFMKALHASFIEVVKGFNTSIDRVRDDARESRERIETAQRDLGQKLDRITETLISHGKREQ